jgi:hypothetical protein
VLDAFVRWDAVHYLSIARDGYVVGSGPWDTNVPFLPLYPWLMALLGGWAGDGGRVAAGLLMSNVSFLLALVLLHRLAEPSVGPDGGSRAALYLAVFPTSFFFSAPYTESLFLLLVLGFFWLVVQNEGRWLGAAILGGLAAATRLPGALLAVVYLAEWYRLRTNPHTPAFGWLGVALFGAGPLVYMAALNLSIGDPQFWHYTLSQWGTGPEGRTASTFSGMPGFGVLFPAAVAVLFIAAGEAGRRTLPRPYLVWFWLYFLIVLALSFSTQAPFYSFIRFVLLAFPAFFVFGRWGARRWFHVAYMSLGLIFLMLGTMLFTCWYWVA